MKFKFNETNVLTINNNVLKVFEMYIQNEPSKSEAGGVLIGRIISKNNDILVDAVTGPHKDDIRKRFFFFRKKKKTQKIVNKCWKKSSGTQIYLGEWHTHPEDVPQPSNHDYKNWKDIFSNAIYEQNFLVFIIVGIEEIGCWMIKNGTCFKLKSNN